MLDKLDKMDVQTRVIVATVISLLFFIPYSYFMAPESVPEDANQPTEQISQSSTEAPTTQTQAPSGNTELAAPQTGQGDAPAIKQSSESHVLVSVKAEHFDLEIDPLGRISQVYLKDEKFQSEQEARLPLFAPNTLPRLLEVRFADAAINQAAFEGSYATEHSEVEIKDAPETILLTKQMDGFTITKTIKIFPDGHYEFSIQAGEGQKFFVSPGYRPDAVTDKFTFAGAIIEEQDVTITKVEDGDAIGNEYFRNARIAAAVDRYYVSMFYDFNEGMNIAISKDRLDNPLVFAEAYGKFQTGGYFGPKDYRMIQSVDERLTSVVEYGFVTFFAKPLFILLYYIHDYVGNWGWAIVILTILVRLVMYPLTHKGMVGMQKLKDLAPKIKELQAKHKGDPQKMQMAMMELYKKHGANPLGGCLPLLLQMPIFFAIYRVLYNAIELKGAEWIFYINDLSQMDPYFILPIIMGVSMYFQQVMTPTTFTDPMQKKVFKFLPLIFTFFFLTFPAGLVLYWLVNNLVHILQQWIINRSIDAKKALAAKEHAK